MSINVVLHGRIVAASRNLRGLRDYARKSPVAGAECRMRNAHAKDPGGVLTVTYVNGAMCSAPFASYNTMVDFVRARRSWRGADIRYLGGDIGYLSKPGIIAGPRA